MTCGRQEEMIRRENNGSTHRSVETLSLVEPGKVERGTPTVLVQLGGSVVVSCVTMTRIT
jgi:hypothetical protein